MVNLVHGINAYILIEDNNHNILYQKRCDSADELRNFIATHEKSKKGSFF